MIMTTRHLRLVDDRSTLRNMRGELGSDLGFEWVVAMLAWEGWLIASQKSPETMRLRLYQVERFARDHPGLEPFCVSLDVIAEWLARFAWAAETRRSYRASLRQFYGWGHITGRCGSNPAGQLPPITPPRRQPRPAPEYVLEAALAAADPRVRLMLRLAANAGMRRGEIARASTEDLVEDLDGWSLRVHGKGGHERLVPLLDDLADELRHRPSGWLFPGQVEGHLSPRRVGELVTEALPGHWTTHTLRHRFASRVYAVDRDLRTVQELLGHASVKTTQVYTQVPAGALRAAVASAA